MGQSGHSAESVLLSPEGLWPGLTAHFGHSHTPQSQEVPSKENHLGMYRRGDSGLLGHLSLLGTPQQPLLPSTEQRKESSLWLQG